MIEYEGILIKTQDEVYKPSPDTFLLLENLELQRRDEVLEIGTGTGIIAVYTAQRTKRVVATDCSEDAVRCALMNTINNKTYNVELKHGDLFEPIDEKYDLILFNTTPDIACSDAEISECQNTIAQFIKQAPHYLKENGRIQLLQSSLCDIEKTKLKLKKSGFEVEIEEKEEDSGMILIKANL